MADAFNGDRPSIISNVVAIIGFIILIVVVIWGLINLASISRGWFSSLFGGSSAQAIEVTAPATAQSGATINVSWKYDAPVEGTYALLYQCRPNFRFQVLANNTTNGIPCGAAYTVRGNSISIIPTLTSSTTQNIPVSILFVPSEEGSQAQGSATIAISPAAAGTPTTPTPTPTKPAPTTPSVPSSPADLSVNILSVTVDGAGNGIATFDITNVGGSSSGNYTFSAVLPTASAYTYYSPTQSSLAPGSHIVNTLRFTMGNGGVFSVSINTSDANSGNNYASQSVYGNSYNYNLDYGYPYSQTASYNQYTYPYNTMYPYSYGQSQYQYPYQQYPYQTQYPYAY